MPRDDTQVREFEMPVVVPDSNLVQALKHVRARLGDHKRWARGTSFKTLEGLCTNNQYEAYSACLGGSISLLGYERYLPKMARLILREANKINRQYGSIPDFNDHSWTTHDVLLNVLDAAIERARLDKM